MLASNCSSGFGGYGWQMGRTGWVNSGETRKTPFQIPEGPDCGLAGGSRAELRARASLCGDSWPRPREGSAGVLAYSAKTRFSRGPAKSRKARVLIGRKRLAAYTRFTGSD